MLFYYIFNYIRVLKLNKMKKIASSLLLYVLFACSVQAQITNQNDILIENERNKAAKIIEFKINANTQNYDVSYHKLEFTVDPAVNSIAGNVTTNFTAKQDLSTITFDLSKSLTVSKVSQGSQSLSFVQNTNNELVITLPSILLSGNSSSLKITYSGTPPAATFKAFNLTKHNNVAALYTVSEPYGARDWWPCKQDLNDKVDNVDIYITAPNTYTAVANGVEQSKTVSGTKRTTYFKHNYPIPAYLIAIAVTNYQIYNQQGGLGTVSNPYFPIVNYLYPENATNSKSLLSVTPSIINFFETKIGNYPFRNEKYGHAECGLGGGMEHTTVSFMGNFSRDLIAHELAHQWFGNKVTCGTWKDIWLNEGFAEYFTGLVTENIDGASSFNIWKADKIASITALSNGRLYLTDTDALNVYKIFDSRISYDKGAMVLNMIRFKLGDALFFQALNNYLNDPLLAYGYATTPQLQAHFEAVSNLDFTAFFNDWVYNQGYPTYSITAKNAEQGKINITVNQTQSDASVDFFEMPLPVRLYGNNNQTLDLILNNTTNGQTFVEDVPFEVTSIGFNINNDIICKQTTVSLSSNNFDLSNDITIFPNPSIETINISCPNDIELKSVIITNHLGQIIAASNTASVSISDWSAGIYHVEITTNKGAIHKKFIKK